MEVLGSILKSVAQSQKIADDALETALYELCDHLHACDCELCPVNEACSSRGGALHKDGRAMLAVLREES